MSGPKIDMLYLVLAVIGFFGFLALSFIIYTVDTIIENSGELKKFEEELHKQKQEEKRIYDIESIIAEIKQGLKN